VASDGRPLQGEADYRALKEKFAEEASGNFAVLPPIPYHPNEGFLDLEGNPPHAPSSKHLFGTDDRARDVLVRLTYGFRISISFALICTAVAYLFGVATGAVLGYYGRAVDIIGLRLVEIWSGIPFLYTVIILVSILKPSFLLLVAIVAAFGWMSITYYIRGEFYREKTRDYVAAAIATGENNFTIMLRHILPNALTPIITFAPFAIVAEIVTLVSLDFLGFGLPAPTPSWGELLGQAKQNLQVWHLVVFPLGAMFVTLQLVVFIGEAVREAFDPKVFSRLR
jgi:microcin C transport system permease protein